ncbi:MAG: zf-TFIIB domain-containing protein [Polyangiaceae bacterium]
MLMRCENCGAPREVSADDSVMRCDYCRATNFVLREKETRLRAEPEHCPSCTAQLFPGKTSSGRVWGCGNCGGIWLDLANSAAIASGKGNEVSQLARRVAGNAAQRPKVGRAPRKCSVCDKPMGMTHVLQGRFSVDACALHGTFFDAGEVEAIVVAMAKPEDRELLLQHARPPLRYDPEPEEAESDFEGDEADTEYEDEDEDEDEQYDDEDDEALKLQHFEDILPGVLEDDTDQGVS